MTSDTTSPPAAEMAADLPLLRRYVTHQDHRAFDAVVKLHAAMVLGTARRIAPEAAEDVAQIVFTEMARRASALLRLRSLGAWLYRVTVAQASRAVRHQVRSRNKHEAFARVTTLEPSTEADPLQEASIVLDAALAELSEADRELLILRYYERLSFHSAAELLGKSEAALRQQASRALDRIALALKRRGVQVPVATLLGHAFIGTEVKAALLAVAARTSVATLSRATSWTTTWATTAVVPKLCGVAAAMLLLAAAVWPTVAQTKDVPLPSAAVSSPTVVSAVAIPTVAPQPIASPVAEPPHPPIPEKNYTLVKVPLTSTLMKLASEANIEFYTAITSGKMKVDLVGRMTPMEAIRAICAQCRLRLRSDQGVWIVDEASQPAHPLGAMPPSATQKQLSEKAQFYGFSQSGLGDAVRFLAADAHLNFLLPREDEALNSRLVSFRFRAPPLLCLSRLCGALGIKMHHDRDRDVWRIASNRAAPPSLSPRLQSVTAIALREQPAKRFDFARSNLRDVMRHLATEAGIDLVVPLLPPGERETIVTFSLHVSPFAALEIVAQDNQLRIWQTHGRWALVPVTP